MIKVRRVGPARTNFADFEMGFFLSLTLSKGYYKKVKKLLDYYDFEVFLGNPSHYKIKLWSSRIPKKKKKKVYLPIQCIFIHLQILNAII